MTKAKLISTGFLHWLLKPNSLVQYLWGFLPGKGTFKWVWGPAGLYPLAVGRDSWRLSRE